MNLLKNLSKRKIFDCKTPTPSLMFYMYVLESERDKKLYFGFTNDLKERVNNHNKGRVFSTRDRRPLKLVYYEAYLSESDARDRERQLKRRAKSFIGLRRRIKGSISEHK